jgi:hypothetical protein
MTICVDAIVRLTVKLVSVNNLMLNYSLLKLALVDIAAHIIQF